VSHTTGASLFAGITGLLIGRMLRSRQGDWYEPEAAQPIRQVAPDDEAVLTRLLFSGGISSDDYRARLGRLADAAGWLPLSL
jgi:hypothetical protein